MATYQIISPVLRCAFCDKILPTVKVHEKSMQTKFDYEAPDMSKIVKLYNYFFHIKCKELPEFSGWLQCFLKRNGQFQKGVIQYDG